MHAYLLRRLLGTIPVVFLISLLIFGLLKAAPGDPMTLLAGESALEEDIALIRAKWGLDQPFLVQYWRFVSNAVQGDLGTSFRYGRPVGHLIVERLPATIELAALAMAISCLVAIPLGVFAGARPNSWVDNLGTTGGLFGISLPSFWFGIMLILLFAGTLHLFPSAGRSSYGLAPPSITGSYLADSALQAHWAGVLDGLRHLALPALTLGSGLAGILMRITRSAVLEVTREEYVTVARAKGLGDRAVLWRHVVRNALIPIITVVGLEMGQLLSGSIITETVFAWPGLGNLLITGVSARDYPLVTGLVLVYTMAFMLLNLAIDGIYAIVDPRIRY